MDTARMPADTTLADNNAKKVDAFTQVFKAGSTVGGVKLEHAWNHDIVRYDDGKVAFLGQGRVTGSSDADKRMDYGRWNGSSW